MNIVLSIVLSAAVMLDALAARNLEAQFNRLVASATFRNAGCIGGFIKWGIVISLLTWYYSVGSWASV